MNKSFQKNNIYLKQIKIDKIFCNIINVFLDTFDQSNILDLC